HRPSLGSWDNRPDACRYVRSLALRWCSSGCAQWARLSAGSKRTFLSAPKPRSGFEARIDATLRHASSARLRFAVVCVIDNELVVLFRALCVVFVIREVPPSLVQNQLVGIDLFEPT